MKLNLNLVTLLIATISATSAFAAPAPWQYHRIEGYDATSDQQSSSDTRRIVAELVTKYNARFTPGVDDIADKSDASSNAFKAFQAQRIAGLRAAGRVEPLFTANMKAAAEVFEFAAVTDENSDLVAVLFSRQKSRAPLSESILLIRPVQALTHGQTIQDAFDETAFYLESATGVDARTGGALSLKYATNISYFGGHPKLAQRQWAEQQFEIAKVDGKWVARNTQGLLARFDVSGGKFGGVSVSAVNR
jgi:hypothetical protein